MKELLEFCTIHVDRSKCDDALRQVIAYLYSDVIKTMKGGMYKGHIERLAIFLGEKMSKVEYAFESWVIR